MKQTLLSFVFAFAFVGYASGGIDPVINEFQPNPVGADPTTQMIELLGAPGASYGGFLSTIEMDGAGGTIDRQTAVSGTFDANGLAVETVDDLENPGFTLVFSTADGGGLGADLDTGNSGVLDDPSVFGTVFDAISIPDDATDSGYYGSQLGGQDFVYTGDEPQLVFRDSLTGAWYAINDPAGTDAFDINANAVAFSLFNQDPSVSTFGAANPFAIPEPATGLFGAMLVGLGLIRRRKA